MINALSVCFSRRSTLSAARNLAVSWSFLSLVTCFALTPAIAAANAQAQAAAEVKAATIRLLEDDYVTDFEKYFRQLPKDVTFVVGGFGRFGIDKYYLMMRHRIDHGIVTAKSELFDLEVDADPSGDAAVTSASTTVTLRDPGCHPGIGECVRPGVAEERFLMTLAWFKRDGKWKLVQMHLSEEPPYGTDLQGDPIKREEHFMSRPK